MTWNKNIKNNKLLLGLAYRYTYYDDDTVVKDQFGNVYTVLIDDNGRIARVSVPDGAGVSVKTLKDELPELEITSRTGFGAILKLALKPRPPYQGEIKQVIDCVS